MRRAVDFGGVAGHPEPVRRLLVGWIHYHHRGFPIRIEKRGGQQLTAARRARDPLRSGLNKLREMTDVVVRTQVRQFASLRVRMHGGKTEVLNMIRTALL